MIEVMTRQRFHSLAWTDRLIWELRLTMQWGVSLNDATRFWFRDKEITAIERYVRNRDGSFDVRGHSLVHQILGKYKPRHLRGPKHRVAS